MEEKIITGNVFDKYHVKNPIYKFLMKGFDAAMFGCLQEVSEKSNKPMKILEVGCGEGLLGAKILKVFDKAAYTGLDIEDAIIDEAKQNCEQGSFSVASVYDLSDYHESPFDLVIVSEVLEHLESPERALNELKKIQSDYFVFSVPREPLWRFLNIARFKYINKLGNTPGHLKHWSKKGFKKLIQTYFNIIRLKSPFPWSMALCEKKKNDND